MTEVQLRFLRAILERLPIERIAEVHVFPPMKQGLVESGIAVIAAVRLPTPAEGVEAVAAPAEVVTEPEATPIVAEADSGAEACDPTEDASREVEEPAPADAQPPAAEAEPVVAVPARWTGPLRHTVYTARYRLTLKGPERGRWELNVVEEADAPLLTVEMVVRGVQQRSGEGADPERLDEAALRALLEVPAA